MRNVYWSRTSVWVCVSVCGRMPTLLHGPGCNLGMVEVPHHCALLGGFAVGAWVALLWQHSSNVKCQQVLVLALCLVVIVVMTGLTVCSHAAWRIRVKFIRTVLWCIVYHSCMWWYTCTHKQFFVDLGLDVAFCVSCCFNMGHVCAMASFRVLFLLLWVRMWAPVHSVA